MAMKYKTKEIWKVIPEHPNYEASSNGNIRNKKTKRVLKPAIHKTGYCKVDIIRKPRTYPLVHRLIMAAFNPSDEFKQVNHKNGIKTDNRLENLEYVTNQENCIHYYKTCAENRILDINKVKEIRKMRDEGFKHQEIADKFGVCKGTINAIICKRRWGWVK